MINFIEDINKTIQVSFQVISSLFSFIWSKTSFKWPKIGMRQKRKKQTSKIAANGIFFKVRSSWEKLRHTANIYKWITLYFICKNTSAGELKRTETCFDVFQFHPRSLPSSLLTVGSSCGIVPSLESKYKFIYGMHPRAR